MVVWPRIEQTSSLVAKLLAGWSGVCVTAILSDLLLFSCLAAFYTGIGFAIVSLID